MNTNPSYNSETLEVTPRVSLAATYDQIEQELGAGLVPRIFKLLESQPELLEHIWGEFRLLILQGQLPRTIKEMVGLVVALTTHCEYVQVIHMHSLTLQGVAKEALEALKLGDYSSNQLNNLSQSVLRFAALSAATRSSYAEPETDWQTLRQQTTDALAAIKLNDSEKLELIGTIALFEQICTIANILNLDPQQP